VGVSKNVTGNKEDRCGEDRPRTVFAFDGRVCRYRHMAENPRNSIVGGTSCVAIGWSEGKIVEIVGILEVLEKDAWTFVYTR
jgi:hypothetical protein